VNRGEGAAEKVGCNEGLGVGAVTVMLVCKPPVVRVEAKGLFIFLPPYKDFQQHG
jgi:hypothetical protein